MPLLLQHKDKYARAVGASLALRMTPLAGGLKVVPRDAVDLDKVGALLYLPKKGPNAGSDT